MADMIEERFAGNVMRFRIAEPIKSAFAEENNLDLNVLLSPGQLKEEWRERMVKWSEEMRSSDPHYFTRRALLLNEKNATRPIWMLTDARRECDMQYFIDELEFPPEPLLIRIKIVASIESRAERGFVYTPGIDDATTECGLDKFEGWNHIIPNDGQASELATHLDTLFQTISKAIQ